MPYRVDLDLLSERSLDRLVMLGALDVETTATGVAALMPDGVDPDLVAAALEVDAVRVSPAEGRDDGSVWILSPRPVRVGRLWIAPAAAAAAPATLRLYDGPAFGTGLHPTTALCLEAIESLVEASPVRRVLDVGTGSGVLALAALMHGVEHAVGIDLDPEALRVAAQNTCLNGLAARLLLVCGGPEAIGGDWPLVAANVQAAPLIDMAPLLIRRVARRGTLVLSGIAVSVASDVERAYTRLGMRHLRTDTRAGWTALVFTTTW